MFAFGRKDSKNTYGVLVDIGSGTVGAAIVASRVGERLPEIVYAHRTTMRITKHRSATSQENVRRARETLLSTLLLLSQEGLQKLLEKDPRARVTKLYVTCSSPWSYTVARDVRYENNEPFKITSSIIEDLVKSAEEEILTHLRTMSQTSGEEFGIVERATVDITINDYPVLHPLNLKGTTLGLSHIVGLIPNDIMSSLEEVQDKLFPDTELRAHTYMLIMYCVLRDLFPRIKSLCIIDVTTEATEFGIVENNLLIENSFVGYGSTTFIREVMSKTGKPASDILTLLDTKDPESILKDTDFKDAADAYIAQVAEAITHVLERRMLPTDIIFTVQRSYESVFKVLIEEALTLALQKSQKVTTIDKTVVTEISHNASDDVYLAIGARFFHKLHGCGEVHEF